MKSEELKNGSTPAAVDSEVASPESSDSGSSSNVVVLRREIGLWGCVSICVGIMIGSGIFISPKGILMNTGTVGMAMVVWVLCGVMSGLGALCFAELGTTFTKSGGEYAFLLEAFGPLAAFLRLWANIIAIGTGTIAVLAITFANYALAAFFSDCQDPPITAVRLVAAAILFVVFYLNGVSVLWTTRVQVFLTIAKCVGLAIIIITGMVLLCKGETEHLQNAFKGSEKTDLTKIPLAFYSGLFAYAGWQMLAQVTEEIKNPAKNLPIGVLLSVGLVMIIYVLTNIAYFTVISPDELLVSKAVAVTFGERMYGPMLFVIPLSVVLSCAGSINGSLLSDSRTLFVAAREGHLPVILSMIHINKRTPLPAVLLMLPICLIMLASDDVYSLINYLSFAKWLFLGLSVAVLPYLRWKRPDLPRPFKVNLIIPVLFILSCLYVVAVSLYSAPIDCGIGLAILLSGVPVYYVCIWWQNKPKWFDNFMERSTLSLQKLMLVVYQEKKTY